MLPMQTNRSRVGGIAGAKGTIRPVTRLKTVAWLLASLLRALPEWVVVYLPGDAGVALRQLVYGRRARHMGRNVVFEPGVQIEGLEWMTFGDDCWIDKYVVLLAGPVDRGERVVGTKENPAFHGEEGELILGDRVHIAPHVVVNAHGGVAIGTDAGVSSGARIYSLSHHYRNPVDKTDTYEYRFTPKGEQRLQALIAGPVVTEENAAIGLNAVLLPGSTIREAAWLGTGAMLRGVLPPGSIAAGNPAEVVGWRPGREPAGA